MPRKHLTLRKWWKTVEQKHIKSLKELKTTGENGEKHQLSFNQSWNWKIEKEKNVLFQSMSSHIVYLI